MIGMRGEFVRDPVANHRDKNAFVRSFLACVRKEYAGSATLLVGAFHFLP
jgi:hypothetical protein